MPFLNGIIFVGEILACSEMVPFKPPFSSFPRSKGGLISGGLRGLNEKSPMVPFLLTNFSHFLKWYILLATKFSPPKPPRWI